MTSTTFSYASAVSSGHLPDGFIFVTGEGLRRILYAFATKEEFISGARYYRGWSWVDYGFRASRAYLFHFPSRISTNRIES